MKKSQHTPGPWLFGKTDRFFADEVTANGRRIAQCSPRRESTTETESNARLIAAAPDMKKELEIYENILMNFIIGVSRNDTFDRLIAAFQNRTALIKAIGE